MSDFLTDVLQESKALIEKDVEVGGKTGKVFFRRITAGERHQLLRGQKMMRQGGATSFELDLAMNEAQQHQLVFFSVCKADGKPFFKDINDVRAADAAAVRALYLVASAITADTEKEEDDAGKG